MVEVTGGRYVQTVYQPTLRRTIQRTFNGTSWGDWGNCNGFNCSTPEALASLLGVPRYIGDINDTANRDDLVSGLYVVSTSTLPAWWFNNSKADGVLEVIRTYENFKMLRYTDFNTGDIYEVYYKWNSWGAWKKITAGNV